MADDPTRHNRLTAEELMCQIEGAVDQYVMLRLDPGRSTSDAASDAESELYTMIEDEPFIVPGEDEPVIVPESFPAWLLGDAKGPMMRRDRVLKWVGWLKKAPEVAKLPEWRRTYADGLLDELGTLVRRLFHKNVHTSYKDGLGNLYESHFVPLCEHLRYTLDLVPEDPEEAARYWATWPRKQA